VALIVGMQVDGGPVDLFGLIVLALICNLVAALFAFGVAFRLRTIQAGPAMQMPVFLILFFAPVYVPLALLSGWVEAVARSTRSRALIEGGRDLISGSRSTRCSPTGSRHRWPRSSVWAVRGLRKAEAAG
jgi:ABC-2 type transport system permease protein